MRAILTFHSVDDSGSVVSYPPGAFRRFADWLVASPLRVVDLPTLLELPDGTDAVALTFDDGYRNFATRAWPLLRERGLPATLFVVTGHVGGTSEWTPAGSSPPARPLLSWSELERLAEEGVEIGAHTRTHPSLAEIPSAAAVREVEGAARDVEERLGQRPESFAYPYGEYGTAALAAVARVYRRACTTRHGVLDREDPAHELPRLDMYYFRDPASLRGWGSLLFRGRVWLRRQGRALRRLLQGPGGTGR